VAQNALRTTLNVMTGRIVFDEIVALDAAAAAARKIARGVRARRELPHAILFDLDETIISFGRREQLLHDVAQHYAARIAPIAPDELVPVLERHMRTFWAEPALHKEWRQKLPEARRLTTANAFAELAPRQPGLTESFAHEFADRFHEHREAQAKFFPDAIETIDELKRRGVKLVLITNGAAAPQRSKIEKFDLLRRFDHIQIEGEHGFGKPEPEAYTHAMKAIGATAEECWIVGDNLEWEVAAPQRLGLYAVWHDHLGDGLPPDTDIRPDRIIQSLSELLPPEF
jgi:putative hydrolase of the HAD superfamily